MASRPKTKKLIGITVDIKRLAVFKALLKKHGLQISPVMDALMQLFIDELYEKVYSYETEGKQNGESKREP